MIVTSLLSLDIFPLHFIESWRVQSPGLFVAQQVRLFVYLALEFWLLLKTPCLGSQPQCNLCKRIYFLVDDHAINRRRRAWLFFLSLMTLNLWLRGPFWAYGPYNYFESVLALFSNAHRNSWLADVTHSHSSVQAWRKARRKALRRKYFNCDPWEWYDHDATAAEGIKQLRWKRSSANHTSEGRAQRVMSSAWLAIRVPRCQRALIGLIFIIIYVYNIEMTTRANVNEAAENWGYGQIATVVLSIPSLMGCLKLFLRLGKEDA